jgi:sulfur relay protein TusB/DsrH
MSPVSLRETCLHLLLSPDLSALEACASVLHEQDEMVLMDTGVLWLTREDELRATSRQTVIYCLEADIKAHGLSHLSENPGVMKISDSQLVGKVFEHRHCLSWK